MKKAWFDVGANNGSDSINVAINNTNIHVFGFEPTPELQEIIEEKLKKFNLNNYTLVKSAVSDYIGKSTFNVAGQSDWGCSSLLDFSDKSKSEWTGRTDFQVTKKIEVDVIRLDKFIEDNEIDTIEFLHIDTQGSDLNVLKGLGDKIKIVKEGVMEAASKPDILYNNQNTLDECVDFLKSNNFKIDSISSNDQFGNEVNIYFSKNIENKLNKKLISHRGNINGQNLNLENEPTYIDSAILNGFDVEIDVWLKDNILWLGHDYPQYQVDLSWLEERRLRLWIHCKNIDALNYLKKTDLDLNYFWHQTDDVTITSKGYFWTYPGKQLTENSIACMPEIDNFENIETAYGICSNKINQYKNKKKALFCFWGKSRIDFKIIKENISKTFSDYDIDFLLSTWYDEEYDESQFNYIIKSQSPTEDFLNFIKFPYTLQLQSNYGPKSWRFGHYSQYFHTLKIHEFINNNNLNYDILCKLRSDLFFESNYQFDFNKNICYIPKNYHCEIGVNDHFMIGRFDYMKKVIQIDSNDIYSLLENSWNPEIALQTFFKINNFNVVEFECQSYKLLPDREYKT